MRVRLSIVSKLARMSLAQFSKNLMSGGHAGRPDCAGGTTEVAGFEGLGQKRFAADVVAAMSNPETPAPGGIPESTAIKNECSSGI
jgi:hypothetical protein